MTIILSFYHGWQLDMQNSKAHESFIIYTWVYEMEATDLYNLIIIESEFY